MPEDTTSTATSGETPNAAATPVTGATNTPSGSEKPPKTAADELEEFKARYAALEKSSANAKDELERHRKNAKKLADYEQKEQERQQAALSDVEKAQKRATDAEAQIQQYKTQLVNDRVRMAAMEKNIRNPSLVASAIREQGLLEIGEDGLPTNLDDVLDKLIKSDSYLVKPAEPTAPAPTTPATPNTPNAPAIPAWNPGRSSINPPSQITPGKPTTLADVQWKR